MTKLSPNDDFAGQIQIARDIMEKDWVALRTLALRDQYPDADLETLLEMAQEQKRSRAES